MKTKTLKRVLLLPALLLCVSIQSQEEEVVVPEDIDFLNPYDHSGNKWFQRFQDRRDFFNNLVAAAKSDVDRPFISVKDDIFIGSIRSDDDHEYDNKAYYNVFLFKSDSEQEVFDDLEDQEEIAHLRDLKFFLGKNITSARFLMDENVANVFSYESLNHDIEGTLTEPLFEIETDRGAWLYGYQGDLYGITKSITLWGN